MKKKKVFVSGHFNVLHPGHLRFLKFAKDQGDELIVAVESNKIAGNNAYVDEKLRLNSIRSIAWVDKAFIIYKPITDYIIHHKPSIIVKGKEFENINNDESKIIKKYGGKLIFSSGEKLFSSIDLLKKEFQNLKEQFIHKPTSFMNRHNIKSTKIRNILKNFSKLKICVIGDLIIDEYVTCEALGMSQEDPTLVISPLDKTKFVGGAGIVAAHASLLGAKVDFYSIAGKDKTYNFAKKKLKEFKVNSNIIIDHSRPTTLKQRFRSSGKTLMRVSYLHQNSISKNIQKKILDKIKRKVSNYDLIVYSDFNYGCLPKDLVKKITELGKKYKIVMAADSQSSSQVGTLKKYKKMNLVTPTEREARITTMNQDDGLIVLAEDLRKQIEAENVVLKLGEEGFIIHSSNKGSWKDDRIKALNNFPKDVAGAGDSLLISAAMSMACKSNIWESIYIGSLASALQVSRVGNLPLSLKNLLDIA